jgi:hypothetical protein
MNEVKSGYTSAADIPSPYSSITLPKLRTAAGDPIRVRFRKLDAADLALARAQFPGAFPKSSTKLLPCESAARAFTRWPQSMMLPGRSRTSLARLPSAPRMPPCWLGWFAIAS